MEVNQEIEEIRLRTIQFQGKDYDVWKTMTDGESLNGIISAEEKHQHDANYDKLYRDPKDGYREDRKQSPVEKLRQDREDLSRARQGFRQDWEHVEERAKDERKHGQPGPWTNLNLDMSQANAEFRGREREIRSTPFSEPERQLLADTDPAMKPDTKIQGGDGNQGAPQPAPTNDPQPSTPPVRDVAAKWAEEQRQGKERAETAEKVNPPPLRKSLADATKPAASKVEDGGKGDEGAPKPAPKEDSDVNPAAARALKTLTESKPSIGLPAVRKFKV